MKSFCKTLCFRGKMYGRNSDQVPDQTNTLQAFAFKSGIAFYMLSGSYRTNFEFRDLKSQISAIFGGKRPGVDKKALFMPKCPTQRPLPKFFFGQKNFFHPKSNSGLYEPKTLPQTCCGYNGVASDTIPVAVIWSDPGTYRKRAQNGHFS